MSCCTAARGFLARIGASDAVSFQESLAIPLLFDGRRWVFRSWPLPGMAHLLPGLLGYAPLSRRERIAALRAGLVLWTSRAARDETFAVWLARRGQTERTIRRLWDPIVIATLNAPSSVVSLRAARHVFREAFFVPHGADIGLFTRPLGDVFDAARRYLEARGGTVELDARVDGVLVGDRRARGVRLSTGREIDGDAVISAVPPDELAGLVSGVRRVGGAGTSCAAARVGTDRERAPDLRPEGARRSTSRSASTRPCRRSRCDSEGGAQTLSLSQSSASEPDRSRRTPRSSQRFIRPCAISCLRRATRSSWTRSFFDTGGRPLCHRLAQTRCGPSLARRSPGSILPVIGPRPAGPRRSRARSCRACTPLQPRKAMRRGLPRCDSASTGIVHVLRSDNARRKVDNRAACC